jgi:hypothetical protein
VGGLAERSVVYLPWPPPPGAMGRHPTVARRGQEERGGACLDRIGQATSFLTIVVVQRSAPNQPALG